MHVCEICKAEFPTVMELENHWSGHSVRPVKERPLSCLLCLPDGVTSGRYSAAEAFVDAFAELQRSHPDRQFYLLPFSYTTAEEGRGPALSAILAIDCSPNTSVANAGKASSEANAGKNPLLDMRVSRFFTSKRFRETGYAAIAERAQNAIRNTTLQTASGGLIHASEMAMQQFLGCYPDREGLNDIRSSVGPKIRTAMAAAIIAAGLPFG